MAKYKDTYNNSNIQFNTVDVAFSGNTKNGDMVIMHKRLMLI